MAREMTRESRPKSALAAFFDSFSLTRCFTLFGFTVATAHVLFFGCDLIFAWPLQRASALLDVTNIFCGITLGCLSWGVFRDQVRESR